MHALLVTNECSHSAELVSALEQLSFEHQAVSCTKNGYKQASTFRFDLIVVMLGECDSKGIEFLRRLRAGGDDTPIIVLSPSNDIDGRIYAFDSGADECISKAISQEELVARISAVTRRCRKLRQTIVEMGSISVNLDTKTVEVHGRPLPLTVKEYQVLELLCLRKEVTLTKEMFINYLYNGLDEPDSKIVDVFICKLRKKLSAATGGERFIETIWGQGYALREPDSDLRHLQLQA